jgi:hypothetical protein
VAFTSASQTFAAPVFSCARRWIWRSQCLWQLPLQVVDDDVLEVVDVLLIGINSWRIHPLRENRSSQLGWSTAKGKKTLTNQRKTMMKFMDIAYPCIWAVPEVTTGVVPSLVHLHHAELTMWTPRPLHRLLRHIASNFMHRSEVSRAFQWEIGYEIFWLLMPQLRTETVFIPTPWSHCLMLWEEDNGANGATYRHKEGASAVGPSIRGKGNEAVTRRKHTLVLGHCRFVGQTICGKGTHQWLKGNTTTLHITVTVTKHT